jgi:hypothetical protein
MSFTLRLYRRFPVQYFTSTSTQRVRSLSAFSSVVVYMLMIMTLPVFGEDVESPLQGLLKTPSLRCSFSLVMQADWESGKLKNSVDKEEDIVLHFDSINPKRGKARLIGNEGATDVVVIPSASGLNFLEETPSGNINFTAIFQSAEKNSTDFIAVTSRHLLFPGLAGLYPFPSQHHGTCKIWQ